MKAVSFNILGVPYKVKVQTEIENPKLRGADGLCEFYSKEIILDTSPRNNEQAFNNIEEYYHKVLRHEAFHAILHEAGLDCYAEDEKLVDALAVLYPRITPVMEKIESLNTEEL